MARLPFLDTQRLFVLRSDADPREAVHPERLHAHRHSRERGRRGSAAPDNQLWEPLERPHFLAGAHPDGRRFDRVALTTDAGLGKSYNCAWLSHMLNAPGGDTTAFLLSISDLDPSPRRGMPKVRSAADLIPMLLAELVLKPPANHGQDRTRVTEELRRRRDQGRLALVFDGLDQAPKDAVELLADLLAPDGGWDCCRVVVAGRPFAFTRHWERLFDGKSWRFVQIGEFDQTQQAVVLGRERYNAILEEARSILTVPRVLEYIAQLDVAELPSLETVSDVYWKAARYMLKQAFRRDVDSDEMQEHLRVLGALAFTMYAGEPHATEYPNLDRVTAADIDMFLYGRVLPRLSRVVSGLDRKGFKKVCKTLSRLNAAVKHGWMDTDDLGDPSEDLLWRNASLQEFFAAYWATRWGREEDEHAMMANWLVCPRTDENRGFYWFWRYATEMPADAIRPGSRGRPEKWLGAMQPLLVPSDGDKRPIRSTEFIWRSHENWLRLLGPNPSPAESYEFLREFRQGYVSLTGEAREIAHKMMGGFNRISGGRFRMGTRASSRGNDDERPQHVVEVATFYLHRYCITNAEYELFDPRHADTRWGYGPHPLVERSKQKSADDRCPAVNV